AILVLMVVGNRDIALLDVVDKVAADRAVVDMEVEDRVVEDMDVEGIVAADKVVDRVLDMAEDRIYQVVYLYLRQ
ncbi:hypothetical protein, partial [Lysinibacillus fusiformis]|uniref:hypothetical protein n=1 Tax=Lysinibacillus fusiformis TaxID=28031 RepID=UPI0020BE11A4